MSWTSWSARLSSLALNLPKVLASQTNQSATCFKVGSLPVCLVGCLVHTLLEVVKKTLLAFGAVEETELIIDDGLCAAALDKLCLLHDAAVVLLLELLSRRSLYV